MQGKIRCMVLFMLMFSLFTGSVGVAATQRFCVMLGMSSSPASAEEMDATGCCSKHETPADPEHSPRLKQASCCSVSTTFQKLDVPSSLSFSEVAFVAAPPMLVSSFLLPFPGNFTVSRSWPFYADTSPPLAGRDLLHRLHTLLI